MREKIQENCDKMAIYHNTPVHVIATQKFFSYKDTPTAILNWDSDFSGGCVRLVSDSRRDIVHMYP
jgi:hypothetical protein